MKAGLIAMGMVALGVIGCADAKNKAEAEAARAAQAKAEAELARIRAETESSRGKTVSDHSSAKSASAGSPAVSELAAPKPLEPSAGSVLSNFPRNTTVKWSPIAGAASYKVEVE